MLENEFCHKKKGIRFYKVAETKVNVMIFCRSLITFVIIHLLHSQNITFFQ